MENLQLFVSLVLLLSVYSQICPVLEGDETSFTCTVLFSSYSFIKQFYWGKRVNGYTSTVAVCDPDYGCTQTTNLPYISTVTSINISSASSTMTIPSATKSDEGSWFCSGSSLIQDVVTCDLRVYGSKICFVLEGKGITLTCTVLFSNSNSFSKELSWVKKVNETTVDVVATCGLNNGCPSSNLPYTFTMTRLNESSATSNMTIASAARTDQGLWFCSGSQLTQDVEACVLKVFIKPVNISCNQPELQNDTVKVTCTGARVYLRPQCQISWINNRTQITTIDGIVSYQHEGSNYFQANCTWATPAQSLGFGSHQFKALIYPNVTGNTATDMSYGTVSDPTFPVEINAPEVVLESCPVGQIKDGYIKEGTPASCTCREKNNSFLKANVRWSGSPEGSVVGKQNSTLNFTAIRNGPMFTCQAEVLGTWSKFVLYVPFVAYPPAITIFTVTGAVNQEVQNNTNVMFSCEAEGNPALSLTLLRDSDSQILGQTDNNNKAILQLNKTMACQDSGIYVCKAQIQNVQVNKTVAINVLCMQQLSHVESQQRAYKECVNKPLSIIINIFGYPSPTLSLSSDQDVLNKDDYLLFYSNQGGIYGTISLKYYSLSDRHFQNYNLEITNTEGTLVYKFQIIHCEQTDVNVGAIVGGSVGVVVAVVIIAALLFYMAKRRGYFARNRPDENSDHNRHDFSFSKHEETELENQHLSLPRASSKAGPNKARSYENTLPDFTKEDDLPQSHYEELADMH